MDDPTAPSGSQAPPPVSLPPSDPLTHEEAPIIEAPPEPQPPAQAAQQVIPPAPPQPEKPVEPPVPSPLSPPAETPAPSLAPAIPPLKPKRRGGFFKMFRLFLFLAVMFAGGVWLSTIVRQYISEIEEEEPFPTPTRSVSAPGEFFSQGEATAPAGRQEEVSWKTYSVVSGTTRQPIPGLSFQLPADVLVPICDGGGCASQGTYLPGGTRLTIAPRGNGQALPDFRGAVLTDAAGREFTMKQTIIGGTNVYEFVGDFAGTTGGGYAFTKMRGVLLPLTDTLSLELNHFTPRGITVDFPGDDVLFDKIVASVEYTGVLSPTSFPVASPTAAPSTLF